MSQPTEGETDKQFNELLQELRVVQTGVQILAAFLLTLPFMNRWHETTATQKTMYTVALSAAACATALVIGPVSYHRTRFGRARGGDLLRTSIWLARAGMASLLIAAVSAVYLALDMGLGGSVAIAVTVPVALVFLTVWYFVPAFRQRHR